MATQDAEILPYDVLCLVDSHRIVEHIGDTGFANISFR